MQMEFNNILADAVSKLPQHRANMEDEENVAEDLCKEGEELIKESQKHCGSWQQVCKVYLGKEAENSSRKRSEA